MTLGPFEIGAERIEALDTRFTEFVSRLLEVERRAHGLRGYLLTVNVIETTPDGGVDAAIRGAPETDWLPEGDTAFQFKRSQLSPAQCADELAGANWAHAFLRDGGSYVLAIGKAMSDVAIDRRRQRIGDKAIELGLINADRREAIRVYGAYELARWGSSYPSLAVSRVAGGPGSLAIDYESWSHKADYQAVWTTDPARAAAIAALRARITATGIVEVRVQGESGLGKTRLVLEAMRDSELGPLVAYVDDERSVSGELLEHLIGDDRVAILVVDECPAERHIKLVQKLAKDSAIKLITIGSTGAVATRTPVVTLEAMPNENVEEFLKSNYKNLSPEARRFVATHSRGNLRWTTILAERVGRIDAAQAADLIARDDIELFITTVLPEGRDFFYSAVIALLERVGWDREIKNQLEIIARFAGVDVTRLESLGRDLERRGLLVKQGRYRAVAPHPLAVFLAATAWKSERERIVTELLPTLDEEMALSFFQRVADLGRFEPATSILPTLLARGGPFESLEAIDTRGLGRLLTQLAIVLPDDVAVHLSELVESSSIDYLRLLTRSRRDLVWTLEKLAWHSRTFATAAGSLLRLAVAENESFANSATGTWVSLFGTFLPGTAASPRQRADYLSRVARDTRPELRLLAIKAASQTFAYHEFITVSGELQGGVLVEPRGSATTWAEVKEYRSHAIDLLELLATDNDPEIAKSAQDALIGALRGMLADPVTSEPLIEALARLTGAALQRLRTEVEQLRAIYDRMKPENLTATSRLQALLDKLPAPDELERVKVLVRLQRWDLNDGELQQRLDTALGALAPDELSAALTLLNEELPAAWELGHALANVDQARGTDSIGLLIAAFKRNPAAIAGYLTALAEAGAGDAFDDFLDSERSQGLDLSAKMFLAVRGPVTERARARVIDAVRRLPVATATFALFGWQRNLSEQEATQVLVDWTDRIGSQEDYNALVDWVNLWLGGRTLADESLRSRLASLVLLRRSYPNLLQQHWAWSQLAKMFVESHGTELARTVLDAVESGGVMIHDGDDDSKLLLECARLNPSDIWLDLANRLLAGSWRVQMEVQGWLLKALPSEVVAGWVRDDVTRARLVASIAPIGGNEPSELTRYILARFGADRQVSAALSSEFMSGFWTGPESDRLAGQIAQLNSWRNRPTEPPGVRDWAKRMVEYLEQRRQAVLEQEAEERV